MFRSVSYYWYRMGNQRLVWSLVVTLTISIQSSHVFAENHCASSQHGYLGKEGIISCNIDQGIDKVYWFNETDGYDYSFIRMEDGHISGSGYKSNEYNISQNGSLVIRNVQCKHQQSYQVTFQISVNESEVNLRVNFIVIDTDNSCNVTTEPQFTTSYTTETTKPGPTTSNSGSTLPSEVTSIVQSTKEEIEHSPNDKPDGSHGRKGLWFAFVGFLLTILCSICFTALCYWMHKKEKKKAP
ncbi:uncharacterized protein [Apostichopus japonicus]|uniref:uncharacterized protein n=1 Tax=Stichopus japonicus TaxID=307972 RepID=UPI003AB8C3FA